MKDILIVPAKNPSTLLACLQSVSKCDLRDIRVVVVEDTNPRPRAVEVGIARALMKATSHLHFHHEKLRGSTSWHSMRHALNIARDGELVFFVEDDYLVEPGFIEWNRVAHKLFFPFVSSAVTPLPFTTMDPSEVGIANNAPVHAGAMSARNVQLLLKQTWTQPWDAVAQTHFAQHKKLSVFPTFPRAFKADTNPVMQNPTTPQMLAVGPDFRDSHKVV